MQPLKISIKDKRYLHILWEDKSESMLLLANLRKSCPCATCVSEREKRASSYIPLLSSVELTIKDIQPIGTYALQLYWQDGHSTGIYTYDKLKENKY
jgi:DUF971 family protein